VYARSLMVFIAGSALCRLATSMTEPILFRVLQGVGGGDPPGGQVMLADAAGSMRMGRVISIVIVRRLLAPILGRDDRRFGRR
jgi:MFS family permease